jgi:hypothetical protein
VITASVVRRLRGQPGGDHRGDQFVGPVEFVESDEFAWHIPGLADKLRALVTR